MEGTNSEHTYRHRAGTGPSNKYLPLGRQGQGLRPATRPLTASVAGEKQPAKAGSTLPSRPHPILLGSPVSPDEPLFPLPLETLA